MSKEINLSDLQVIVASLSFLVTLIIVAFVSGMDGDDAGAVAGQAIAWGIIASMITILIMIFPEAAGICIFVFLVLQASMRAGRWWRRRRPLKEE
jgi:hypothetical protein